MTRDKKTLFYKWQLCQPHNFTDTLVCICLSGFPSDENITTEMTIMMIEFYKYSAIAYFTQNRANAIINTVVWIFEKRGRPVLLKSCVNKISTRYGSYVQAK